MYYNEDFIRDAIYYETERGGQVFFIHNRVQGLPEMAALIQGLCPDLSIGFAHGQMEGHELEERFLILLTENMMCLFVPILLKAVLIFRM